MATLGNTTPGVSTYVANPGVLIAVPYTLASDSYFWGFRVYADRDYVGDNRSQAFRATVYRDSAGLPGALDCVTPETIVGTPPPLVQPAAWIDVPFASEQLVTAGTVWLGSWYGNSPIAVNWHRSGTSVGKQLDSAVYSSTGDPPDPFGTPDASGAARASLYAIVSPVTDPPLNVYAPFINGTSVVGMTLTATNGDWIGNVTGYSYQWKRNGVDIVGETNQTYTLTGADLGLSLSVTVTATNINGSAAVTSAPILYSYACWDPAAQPLEDPDTIWLMDLADDEANWPAGLGGLIDDTGQFDHSDITTSDPFRPGSPYVVEAGRFTDGVRGSGTTNQFMWMPGQFLPRDQFTVEFWVKADNNWSGQNLKMLDLASASQFGSSGVYFNIASGGKAEITALNRQVVPVIEGIGQIITDTAAMVAGDWVGLALTFDGENLVLYRTLAGETTEVGHLAMVPPVAWSCADRTTGLVLLNGNTSDEWIISDLRISRVCRIPGTAVPVTGTNTVTVTDTATGDTVNTFLRGGVGSFAKDSTQVGNATIESLAADNITVMRVDKILSSVRIKAGAPDATHPTLGNSGSYSYNWGPIDNTLDYSARLGCGNYLGLGSTPQLLGGSAAPFSDADCADPTKLIQFSAYNDEVPNDTAAYATMAADLVHYVEVTRGETVLGWSHWNEPDVVPFWAGTANQMWALYVATANAVRASVPGAVLGCFELAGELEVGNWVGGLFAYLETHPAPMDYVGIHLYTGDLGQMKYLRTLIDGYVDTYSFPNPVGLRVGEWGWNSANAALQPFETMAGTLDRGAWWWLNDWGAAFDASYLIAAQQIGVDAACYYYNAPGETTDSGFNQTVNISATHRWVGMNVMDVWKRLSG